MAKKKFYVVWIGRKTGIFHTWEECSVQVTGFANARYKSFDTRELAEQAFKAGHPDASADKRKQSDQSEQPKHGKTLSEDEVIRIGKPIEQSYSVDAACEINPGKLEYRCVHTQSKMEIFSEGPFEYGTNNIGEFLAIVHALIMCKDNKITAPIYSDSDVAIGWVERKKCKTNLERNNKNQELFDLIKQAEKWLVENDYENRVIKWETQFWGEIPADYGRKNLLDND